MTAAPDIRPGSVLAYHSADGSDLSPTDQSRIYFGLAVTVWAKIGAILLLMAVVFWPNLRRLWLKTNPISGEPNWGHAVFVPIAGLYYLYVNREELLALKPVVFHHRLSIFLAVWGMFQAMTFGVVGYVFVYLPDFFGIGLLVCGLLGAAMFAAGWVRYVNRRTRQVTLIERLWANSAQWFGIYTLVWGLLFYQYGIFPGQNDMFKDYGMVITLFGVTLAAGGWPVMRVAWFPIAFLVCAIPWSGLLYSRIAGPLQTLAAEVAVHVLQLARVAADDAGTTIQIIKQDGTRRSLNVAEACAGLRSLMTFVSVGAAYAFLSARPLWQKILITAMAVPIAIFCNVVRVSGQGLLDYYVHQDLSQGFAHQFVGMLMLIPAFFLILFTGWLLDKLFVEHADRRAGSSFAGSPASTRGAIPLPAASPRTIPLPPGRPGGARSSGTLSSSTAGNGKSSPAARNTKATP